MPKLHLYVGFEQVSQVYRSDSQRSQNHLGIKAKDDHSSSHIERNMLFRAWATSKQTFHKSYINLNNSWRVNKQQTHSVNGFLRTFLFYPTETLPIPLDPWTVSHYGWHYAVKSQILSVFFWLRENEGRNLKRRFFIISSSSYIGRSHPE